MGRSSQGTDETNSCQHRLREFSIADFESDQPGVGQCAKIEGIRCHGSIDGRPCVVQIPTTAEGSSELVPRTSILGPVGDDLLEILNRAVQIISCDGDPSTTKERIALVGITFEGGIESPLRFVEASGLKVSMCGLDEPRDACASREAEAEIARELFEGLGSGLVPGRTTFEGLQPE